MADPAPHDAHFRLLARLSAQAEDVKRLTSELDEAAISRRVVPDKWSVKELVVHLLRVQDVFRGRIEVMLEHERPTLAPYSPEGDAEFERLRQRPGGELVAAFLAARGGLVARLGALSKSDWHRAGTHPEYASYDVHFAAEYLAHHEAHHVYQMFTRRALLGRIPH